MIVVILGFLIMGFVVFGFGDKSPGFLRVIGFITGMYLVSWGLSML